MLIVAIVFLLLVVVFALQNAQMVEIRFLPWSLQLNLALVVLGSMSIGVLIGAVWLWVRNISLKAALKDASRQLEAERNKSASLEKALEEAYGSGGRGGSERKSHENQLA